MIGFKKWTTMAIILLLLCSCTTVKRGMLDNHTYYSTSDPNIRIDVQNEFIFNKDVKQKNRYEFINPEAHREVLIEYIMPMVNENQVDYWKNPINWIFYTISGSEEITKGEMTILDKKWYFRDLVYHHSTASCFLIRDMGHFTGRHNVLKVLYSQQLPPYQCSQWKNIDQVDITGNDSLSRFLNNLERDIRMTRYEEQ